jgi:hypothetical protein
MGENSFGCARENVDLGAGGGSIETVFSSSGQHFSALAGDPGQRVIASVPRVVGELVDSVRYDRKRPLNENKCMIHYRTLSKNVYLG